MKQYIIGIDGGGTKTEACIAEITGKNDFNIIGYGTGGPSNFIAVGKDRFKQNIEVAIKTAIKNTNLPAGFKPDIISLGVAGTNRLKYKPEIFRIIKSLKLTSKIIIETDAVIALLGALGGSSGVIVISGTGAVACGMDWNGVVAYSSGWGSLFGDEGSGYYIGKQAIIAALKSIDGRGKPTFLEKLIRQEFRLKNIEEIVSIQIDKNKIANLSEIVKAAAENNKDKVAIEILKKAGEELGLAANAVISKLQLAKKRVLFSILGGVGENIKIVRQNFIKTVKRFAPESEFVKPKNRPIIGAIFLAFKKMNLC